MALNTYADLQSAVSNWLKRSDLTNYVGDLITLGETWIYRHARAREMETALSVTISSGVAALPADFIALKNARIEASSRNLSIRPAEWIYDQFPNRSASGVPSYVAVEGSNLIFGPYSDGAYTISGTYYANLGAVSASAHALFTANPDLYLFAALGEAELFVKNDPRSAVWMAKRDQILADVNGQAQESRFSQAGGLAVRVA